MVIVPVEGAGCDVIFGSVIRLPEMKPVQRVIEKADGMSDRGKPNNRLQKAARCKAKSANRFATLAASRARLW
jgi:hypothetical protein